VTKDVLIIDSLTINASISMTRRLSNHLPKIEEYINQGVPYRVIIDSLNNIGFDLDLATFNRTLYKLRKKARKQSPTAIKQEIYQIKPAEDRFPKPVLSTPTKKNSFKYDVHEQVIF